VVRKQLLGSTMKYSGRGRHRDQLQRDITLGDRLIDWFGGRHYAYIGHQEWAIQSGATWDRSGALALQRAVRLGFITQVGDSPRWDGRAGTKVQTEWKLSDDVRSLLRYLRYRARQAGVAVDTVARKLGTRKEFVRADHVTSTARSVPQTDFAAEGNHVNGAGSGALIVLGAGETILRDLPETFAMQEPPSVAHFGQSLVFQLGSRQFGKCRGWAHKIWRGEAGAIMPANVPPPVPSSGERSEPGSVSAPTQPQARLAARFATTAEESRRWQKIADSLAPAVEVLPHRFMHCPTRGEGCSSPGCQRAMATFAARRAAADAAEVERIASLAQVAADVREREMAEARSHLADPLANFMSSDHDTETCRDPAHHHTTELWGCGRPHSYMKAYMAGPSRA
jgi:hypothetical protein